MPLGHGHVVPRPLLHHTLQGKVCGSYRNVQWEGPAAPRDDAPGALNIYSKRRSSDPTRSTGFRIGHGEEPAPNSPSRRRKPQKLLQVRPNTNRAQEVEKRHRAIRHVLPLQPPMTHLLNQPNRDKR